MTDRTWRQRHDRRKERKARRVGVLHVEQDIDELADALVELGILPQWDDHDRKKIEEAAGRALRILIESSRRHA
jgi:hypothetical protein